MWPHKNLNDIELRGLIRQQQVRWGGNQKLKIYGRLQCASGKRMKRENRVFFKSELEAKQMGFRPCGHCMPKAYADYRANNDKMASSDQ